MRSIWITFFLIAIMSVLAACNNGSPLEKQWISSIDIPNGDFVFSTIIIGNEHSDSKREILGFYSFKENKTTYLDLGDQFPLVTPFYLNNDTIISTRKIQNVGLTNLTQSYLTITSNNSYLECTRLLGAIFPYENNILVADSTGVFLISKNDCSTLKTIISGEELYSISKDFSIGPYAYSETEGFILLSIDSNLVKLSLENGEIKDYRRDGINPVLSPNQQNVAYLSYDGIHIMDVSGDNDTLAIPYLISTYDGFALFDKGNPPTPFWSSNNEELIYHKCMLPGDTPCHNIADYGIYVYELKTKTEKFILKGGLYPSWNYTNP